MKITIHEGLTRLKTLQSRIDKITTKRENSAIGLLKNNQPADITYKSKEDMENTLKANFQSLKDLLNNYIAIKTAIDMSNSATKITVAGKTYTITEALAYKNNIIPIKRNFLYNLKAQLDNTQRLYDIEYKTVQNLVEKNNMDADLIKELFPKILDPNGLGSYISTEEQGIEQFLEEIDNALVTSNVSTSIEV